MSAFAARYRGFCSNCDDAIVPGDVVEYVDEELVHAECSPREEKPLDVCAVCWLVKPCGCDS
jgi:hypothetical protein